MKAIVVHQCGGPEQLHYQEATTPTPGHGQARVKISHVGVNFIDIYFRMGLYKADLPMILGMEASGVVESIGDLRIQDGRVTEMFGLSRDVTRETRREAIAIGRNRLLQDLISSMPAPVVILDEHLTIVDCSAFWLRCHKLVDRSDAVGKKFYELFPSMPPALREENERALAGEVIRTRRNFVNPTTGGKMECHAVITRWMAAEDKVGGIVILVGWHELGVAAAAQKVVEASGFDGSLLDLLKEVG